MNRTLRKAPILVGSALALLPVACGSASSSSSTTTTAGGATTTASSAGGVAAATAELAKYTQTAALIAPGPAFDASKASGKTVWIVEQLAANPVVAIVAQNVGAALTHQGVKVDL